jgi:hypothetical protein
MTIATIRAKVKSTVEDNTDTRNVHEHPREIRDPEEIKDNILDENSRLHFWTIDSSERGPEYYACSILERFYEFTIKGYYGLTDADGSRNDWEDIVSSVVKDLYTNRSFNNTATESIVESSEIGETSIGGVRCHEAEIVVVASELDQDISWT